MNLEAIANYLPGKTQLARKSIFVTEMPAPCDIGILLLGNYAGTAVNHELPGYYATEFRLVVRHTDYTGGLALANKAAKALTSHGGFTAGGLLVRQSLPQNLPRPYRRSAGGYWEFEVDVAITFTDLSA